MVAVTGPNLVGNTSPRCLVRRNCGPSRSCAAVAPRQTTMRGRTAAISASSQGRQAAISREFGFLCSRILPRGSHLKCFTALVTYTSVRSMPADSRHLSSSKPAGPTNGFPCWSSRSPGCSPTRKIGEWTRPSPNTTWVACV